MDDPIEVALFLMAFLPLIKKRDMKTFRYVIALLLSAWFFSTSGYITFPMKLLIQFSLAVIIYILIKRAFE